MFSDNIINDYNMEFFDETDSTNNEAKRRIERSETGLSRPLVIAARSQTAGRGRQGKSFYSPRGTGIYLTAVCPMGCSITGQVTITSKTAVAVARAIEGFYGIECSIKWVNDIYVNDRKCCGILCEAVNDYENNRLRYVIIGVGVNVYTTDWPGDIADVAGSIKSAECGNNGPSDRQHPGRTVMSDEEFTGFARKLAEEILHVIYAPDGNEGEYYRSHSCVIGHEITFSENTGSDGGRLTGTVTHTAKAVGIDDNGGLIVELATGEKRTLDSGEITVRRV